MKKILLLFVIFSLMFILVSCYSDYKVDEIQPPIVQDGVVTEILGVQYIRTDGYNDNFEYPRLIRITSRESLDYYYNSFNGIYSLGSRDTVYSDSTIGFINAIEKYDDGYFKNCDLYLAVLEEGSGSIRHLVEDVDDGYVKITSLLPGVCTEDMAEWHIILEVNKNKSLKGINRKETPIYTPKDIYSEFLGLLEKAAIDYLKELGFENAQLTAFTRTDFASVMKNGFENPLGYNPGYPESPVWKTTVGELELYLCDAPFVFGYKNIPS